MFVSSNQTTEIIKSKNIQIDAYTSAIKQARKNVAKLEKECQNLSRMVYTYRNPLPESKLVDKLGELRLAKSNLNSLIRTAKQARKANK